MILINIAFTNSASVTLKHRKTLLGDIHKRRQHRGWRPGGCYVKGGQMWTWGGGI